MIELITKFVSWIKDAIALIISLPSQFGEILSVFSSLLSWLPNGLGTIITGLVLTAVVFVVVWGIVKLVSKFL